MPERGEIVHVPREESDEERGADLSDLDPVFLEQLRLFPGEIQQAFAEVPPGIRRKMCRANESEKKLQSKGRSSGMRVMDTEEFVNVFEEMARDIRHERNEWTAAEIEEMDPVRREVIARNTLYDFLNSIGIESWYKEKPEELALVMDSLWSNRGRRDEDIVLYRAEHFQAIEKEFEAKTNERQKIIDPLTKLTAKKGHNRLDKKRRDELSKELMDKFGVFIDYQGVLQPSIFSSENGKKFEKMEEELSKAGTMERVWQTGLARFLEYMDATDFSLVFSETFDFIFHWIKRRDPTQLQKFYDIFEDWHGQHTNDRPLKTSEKISLSNRQQKLIEHFWRLFNSYVGLKKSADETDQARASSGIRELAVVLNLLK